MKEWGDEMLGEEKGQEGPRLSRMLEGKRRSSGVEGRSSVELQGRARKGPGPGMPSVSLGGSFSGVRGKI